jgi:hypothetical protein
MDNIVITKEWEDNGLLELHVIANNDFISVCQSCYIQDIDLKSNSDQIVKYLNDYSSKIDIVFGKLTGNYTPAFAISILPADCNGHVTVELDMEIADNDQRKHRCSFYVKTELGMIEAFGKDLKRLLTANFEESVSLN